MPGIAAGTFAYVKWLPNGRIAALFAPKEDDGRPLVRDYETVITVWALRGVSVGPESLERATGASGAVHASRRSWA